MFVGVGVIIELNAFFYFCKKQFATFGHDLNVYIKEWHKNNKGDDIDAMMDMVDEECYQYFMPIHKQITVVNWNPKESSDDKKYVMFGMNILVCDAECTKSIDFNVVNKRTEELKIVCEQFGFSDGIKLFVGDD
jgi:hypothetical protein